MNSLGNRILEELQKRCIELKLDVIFKERKADIAVKGKYNIAFIHKKEKTLRIDALAPMEDAKKIVRSYSLKPKNGRIFSRSFAKEGCSIFIDDYNNIEEVIHLFAMIAEKAKTA